MIKECKVFIRNGEFSDISTVEKFNEFEPLSYIQIYNYKYDSLITRTRIVVQYKNQRIAIEHENLVTLILFKPKTNSIQQELDSLMFELRHNLYNKIKAQLNIVSELKDFKAFKCEFDNSLELSKYQFDPIFDPLKLISVQYNFSGY